MCRIVLASLLIIVPSIAIAQPCEDWSGRMQLQPTGAGGFDCSVNDGRLIALGPDGILRVYDPVGPEYPVLGQVSMSGMFERRLADVNGQPFFVGGSSGLFRIDLSDVASPTFVPVVDPDPAAQDVAGFAGGVALLDSSGDLYLYD